MSARERIAMAIALVVMIGLCYWLTVELLSDLEEAGTFDSLGRCGLSVLWHGSQSCPAEVAP